MSIQITIYFKNNTPPLECNISLAELRKMVNDFETYTLTGNPKRGTYTCQVDKPEELKPVLINFDDVSLIL